MPFRAFADRIESAKQGDSEALSDLMDQFRPLVRGVLGNVFRETALLSVGDSEQDVWTKVWRQLGTFRGHDDPEQCQNLFAAWLSKTAKNVALDEVAKARAQKRGGGNRPAEYVDEQVPVDEMSPSSIVRVRSQATRLRAEMETLDALTAEVLRLRFYESMTINGIADHTQLTIDKVRSMIEKTLVRLKIQVPE